MFVTENDIAGMVARYGEPSRKSFQIPVSPEEYARIRSSQKQERNHDVTLYIMKGEQVVVIAKHFYPPGMYRAPSGGINLGEGFEEGAKREAREETGCEIAIERFLLRTDVQFEGNDEKLYWRSFVFQARYLSGDFEYTDTHEIREAKFASLDEFDTYSRIMRDSSIGGLHYRAALHDAVKGLLELSI